MAGIGLRLNKVIARGTYLESLTAFLSSVIITSGPWLSTLIALALLGSASVAFLPLTDRSLLFATITYAFSASLIMTGGPQMVLTRYLADRLYLEDHACVAPTCNGVLLLAIVPASGVAVLYLVTAPFDLRLRLVTTTLFMTMTLTWLLVIFLSATRSYLRLFLIFLSASALSIGAAIGLGHLGGLLGTLGGFTLGQMVGVALLISRVYREFLPINGIDLRFLTYFWRFKSLFALGTLYAIGLWADQFLWWFSPGGTVIGGYFHLFPAYDTAKMIPLLTTIPGSALFLVYLEVNFYHHYRDFYQYIRARGSLHQIRAAKAGMMEAVQSGFAAIIGVQCIMGMLLFAVAPRLAASLGEPNSWIRLLRITTLAVSCQFLMLQLTILLLYLDQRRVALFVVLLFAGGNLAGTLALRFIGNTTLGLGYLIASLSALLCAIIFLFSRLHHLEYLTFTSQPMRV